MRNIRKFFCKRGFAVVTSLAMCASLVLPSFAAATFNQLQDAVDHGTQVDGITVQEVDGVRNITLSDDVTHQSSDSYGDVRITSGDNIVLDLAGHTITGQGSGNASAIWVNGGSLTLNDSSADQTGTITGGTNAGVYVENNGSFTMNGGSVSGNTKGGVVVVNNGAFTMSGGVISDNNRATGGGVYVDGGSFTMNGGAISGNEATANYGGGVYVTNGTFTMENGTISGNIAAASGGGVGIQGATATFIMKNGSISNNTATNKGGDGGGGGVWIKSGATFTMEDGKITGNTVNATNGNGNGGGVAIHQGTFKMKGGTIAENSSPRGTGVLINAGSQNGNAIFEMSGGSVQGDVDTSCIWVEESHSYNATFKLTGNAVMWGTIFLGQGTQLITSDVMQPGSELPHKLTGFNKTDEAGTSDSGTVSVEETENEGYTGGEGGVYLDIQYKCVADAEKWVVIDTTHSHPCTICGKPLNPESHRESERWGEWSSDDTTHTRYKTCLDCGATVKTETSEHTWSAWSVDNGQYTRGRSVVNGQHTRKCTVCGATQSHSPNWSSWSEAGDSHSRSCSVCGIVDSADHTWGDWSDAQNGQHSRTCTAAGCTAVQSEPHTWGDWVDNEDGKTQTRTCSDCSATENRDKPEEPDEPIVPPVTPEEPIVPPVTPEEPVVPPVAPEEPIVPSEPETPEVPVTPEEPDEEGPAVPSEDPDEEEPDDIVIDDTTIPLAPAPGIGAGAALPDEETELEEIELEDEIIPLSGLFTRADAIGYLWEKAGSPETGLSDFEDVSEDHPWAVAIGWAQAMGIAVADEDGNFRPDDLLLRSVEDLEVDPEGEFQQFLNRYAVFAGVAEPGETFLKLEGEVDDIIMGEDAQVIFDEFFRLLEEEAAA